MSLEELKNLIKKDTIFISTKDIEEDKDACLKLCQLFEKNGIKYWCMHQNNIGLESSDWREMINKALPYTAIFMPLISKNVFNDGEAEFGPEMRNELRKFKESITLESLRVVIPVQLFDGKEVVVQRGKNDTIGYSYTDILKKVLEIPVGTLFRTIDESIVDVIKSELTHYKENCLNHIIRKIEELEVRHTNELYECSEQLESRYKDELKKQSILLELQNYCLQRKCISSKVSDYILTSKELSPTNETAELHIVTNEFWHYDFTALATLAISENIRNYEVKYIYYYPSNVKNDFMHLKNRVAAFMRREDSAIWEFDTWFRARINEAHGLVSFLENDFYNSTITNILDMFEFKDENLEKKFKNAINELPGQRGGVVLPHKNLIKWLEARDKKHTHSYRDLRNSIEPFRVIVDIIDSSSKVDDVSYKNRISADLRKKLKYIIDLFDFSEWFTGKKTNEDYKRILDNLLKNEYIPDIEETRVWIETGNGADAGARPADKTEAPAEEIIERNLIGIEIPENIPIKMCYSFCLYVSGSMNVPPSVAWYDCDSDTVAHATNIDENIFIFAPGPAITVPDEEIFKEAYIQLIDNIPLAKQILTNNNCYYILNILYGDGEV